MKAIVGFLLIVWQLPQTLLGFAVYCFCRAFMSKRVLREGVVQSTSLYAFCLFLQSRRSARYSAFSLGIFIFVFYDSAYPDSQRMQSVVDEVVKHEFGHSVQSMWLGWLYLIIIGIVSLTITGISSRIAKRCYTEKWANSLVKDKNIKITYI